MLLLNSIGILLLEIFNLIGESECLILNKMSVDFCICIDNLSIHIYLYIYIYIYIYICINQCARKNIV